MDKKTSENNEISSVVSPTSSCDTTKEKLVVINRCEEKTKKPTDGVKLG